jgi:hypothetical protein
VVDAIKSSAEVKRNEKSRVTRVGGMKDAVEGSKKTRFRRVMRHIGGLKSVEVWRRDIRRLNLIEEEALKDFGNIIEVRDRAVVWRKRLIETSLFEERIDGGRSEKGGKLTLCDGKIGKVRRWRRQKQKHKIWEGRRVWNRYLLLHELWWKLMKW